MTEDERVRGTEVQDGRFGEMKAGKELDALIAKRVFGWEFKTPRHGYCCTCQHCGRASDNCFDSCYFSEDDACAFQVFKKGLELCGEAEIIGREPDDIMTVGFWNKDGEMMYLTGPFPGAVCLALLTALGEPC